MAIAAEKARYVPRKLKEGFKIVGSLPQPYIIDFTTIHLQTRSGVKDITIRTELLRKRQESFAKIVQTWQDKLGYVARARKEDNPETVRDIMQTTWERLWKHCIKHNKDPKTLNAAILYASIENMISDNGRMEMRRLHPTSTTGRPSDENAIKDIPDPYTQQPFEDAEHFEESTNILKAVWKVTKENPPYQKIWGLIATDQATSPEIRTALGLPDETAARALMLSFRRKVRWAMVKINRTKSKTKA